MFFQTRLYKQMYLRYLNMIFNIILIMILEFEYSH